LTDDEVACGTPGYVAPEILRGDKYGCEVDVWSVGVICYILIAGYPPFYDEDQKKLYKKIKEGSYIFHDEYWSNISPEAVDLIKKMLIVNQQQRWTAKQLLQHPWLQKEDKDLSKTDLSGALASLQRFNAKTRLRATADAIILTDRIRRMSAALGLQQIWP